MTATPPALPVPHRSRVWRFATPALALLAVLSIGHFCWASYNTLRIGFADINVFLYRVWAYLKTGALYLDSESMAWAYAAGRSVLKFPPLYVVPYRPWVDVATGIYPHLYGALFALHVARYVVCALLCAWWLGPRRDLRWWLLVIVLFALCAPFYEALYGLTFDNLFLFLLVLSAVFIRLRRPFWPLFLLGYAANAKLYPALQLVAVVLPDWRKRLAACVPALAVWLLLALAVYGVDAHRFYFGRILPVLLQEETLCETGNLSLAVFLCAHPAWFSLLKGLWLAATLAVSAIALRRHAASVERDLLLFALYTCLPLLVMQNMWGNYQLILLLPLCVLLSYAFRHRGAWAVFAAVCALFAWLPLIASDNYPAMNIPYYALLDGAPARVMIDDLKPWSAPLLWSALAFLLLAKEDQTA